MSVPFQPLNPGESNRSSSNVAVWSQPDLQGKSFTQYIQRGGDVVIQGQDLKINRLGYLDFEGASFVVFDNIDDPGVNLEFGRFNALLGPNCKTLGQFTSFGKFASTSDITAKHVKASEVFFGGNLDCTGDITAVDGPVFGIGPGNLSAANIRAAREIQVEGKLNAEDTIMSNRGMITGHSARARFMLADRAIVMIDGGIGQPDSLAIKDRADSFVWSRKSSVVSMGDIATGSVFAANQIHILDGGLYMAGPSYARQVDINGPVLDFMGSRDARPNLHTKSGGTCGDPNGRLASIPPSWPNTEDARFLFQNWEQYWIDGPPKGI